MTFVTITNNIEKKDKNLKINFNPSVAKPLPKNRKQWKPGQDDLILLSGGGVYLINKRFVFLVKRSAEAPSNPNHWTISTGLTDSVTEIQEPKFWIRELFEEIVLLNASQKLILPNFDDLFLSDLAVKAITQSAKKAKIRFNGIESVKAELKTQHHPNTVQICSSDKLNNISTLSFISEYKMLHTLFTVSLNLEYLDSIKAVDTELNTQNNKSFPLNRKVRLVDIFHFEKEGNELYTPQTLFLLKFLKETGKKNG